jgi:pimeloyl-ACP methyl ester carboxylesterase
LILALRSFANGALFAEVMGDRPPRVLALHGWGRRGADFKPSLEGLPALAIDLPGFGASPPPGVAIDAGGYAAIVAQMLEEFDGPPVLIGHSFGGKVAVALAARHPDRIAAVVATGAPLLRIRPAARPSAYYRALRRLNRIGLVGDARLEAERRRRGSADYRAATGVMRDVLVMSVNETHEADLRDATMPMTLLWGAEDTEVPVAVAERALEIRSGLPTSLEVLPGVGHFLPTQAPGDLRRVVEGIMR